MGGDIETGNDSFYPWDKNGDVVEPGSKFTDVVEPGSKFTDVVGGGFLDFLWKDEGKNSDGRLKFFESAMSILMKKMINRRNLGVIMSEVYSENKEIMKIAKFAFGMEYLVIIFAEEWAQEYESSKYLHDLQNFVEVLKTYIIFKLGDKKKDKMERFERTLAAFGGSDKIYEMEGHIDYMLSKLDNSIIIKPNDYRADFNEWMKDIQFMTTMRLGGDPQPQAEKQNTIYSNLSRYSIIVTINAIIMCIILMIIFIVIFFSVGLPYISRKIEAGKN